MRVFRRLRVGALPSLLRTGCTSAAVVLRAGGPSALAAVACAPPYHRRPTRTTHTAAPCRGVRPARGVARASSLVDFHPSLARTWLAAAANKMLQPQHVRPDSRKLAWWACPACGHQFTRRIDLHVAAGGACPSCHVRPALDTRERAVTTVVHRCRPDNSRPTLAAPNGNRVKASVADGCYLRVTERRNLLPMLAKLYVKEAKKIAADEPLYVSPKLDGIRCIVAYDKVKKTVLFFSRSGTLFECCDAKIEPALRHAFARDPSLVLDGELYNDSANLHKLHGLAARQVRREPFLRLVREAAPRGATSCAVVSFEQLVSAIRTTRERRTPAVAALQTELQLHLFDVLYADAFAKGAGSEVPYVERHAFLRDLLRRLHAHNQTHLADYDPHVLRLVPSWCCVKANVQAALRAATTLGYEGVMVRRTPHGGTTRGEPGGYAYGQRSDSLLKYKLMQDDEFVIVLAVEGKGKWKGQLGAFLCETHDKRHTFSVAPASTDGEKRRMWRLWRRRYKGKALTVQYQELTPDGVPRFPVAKCVRGAPDGKDWI